MAGDLLRGRGHLDGAAQADSRRSIETWEEGPVHREVIGSIGGLTARGCRKLL